MGRSMRHWPLALLLVLTLPAVADAGWPALRVRRQVAAARHPVVAPTPAVDLGTVPRYPWGYFGAKPDPYHVYHRGYYGDYSDWSFRRGP
ncbi:MAG: hypothetical protein HY000_36955 [Planctomycetes bacterium]|nr:hypothetical protein [Planctomycetota bacterium]